MMSSFPFSFSVKCSTLGQIEDKSSVAPTTIVTSRRSNLQSMVRLMGRVWYIERQQGRHIHG